MNTRKFALTVGLLAVSCAVETTSPPVSEESGGTGGAGAGTGGAGGATGGTAGTGTGGTTGGSGGAGATGGTTGGLGGTAGAGGALGGSGGLGVGGTVSGMSGGAGAGSGGAQAGGGAGGGSGVGGATGGAGASGGSAGAGAGGAGSAGQPAGGVGGMSGAVASMGCGKGGRPSSTSVPNTIVSFPQSYDGTKPFPLLFGLHGAGRTNDQFRTVDARTQGTPIEDHNVVAYVRAAGSGWALSDRSRIETAYMQLSTSYCIDTNRVFATGHSSGAQMIVQLMCAGNFELFTAIAPVASSKYCNSWDAIPTLLIHGANDQERASTSQDANGRTDLGPYVTSNGCQMTTMPHTQAGCSSGGTQVNPGCVDYQGCSETLIWCSHNDPNYSNTNHGWPCFANAAIDTFLQAQ